MKDKQYPSKGNTIIGNDVWIGYNATILPGITIGDGAIIAANTTVSKDVLPYSIVGGNPSKIIKKRFTDEKIETLLELKWWDWHIEKITKHVADLTGDAIINLKAIANEE
nr:CatB-related O-acetyltransferase [uncultured Flavobacterium sp.]